MNLASAPVSHWMSRPPIKVELEAPLSRIENVLDGARVSGVPVVGPEDRLVGVVSQVDLLRAPLEARNAADVMSRNLVIAHPREQVGDVVWRMLAQRVHRIVVVDTEDHVLGVFTASDALPLCGERSGRERLDELAKPVVTIELGQSTEEALLRLTSTNVRGLVVVDGTVPVGVFTHAEALASRRLPRTLRSAPIERTMSFAMLELDDITPARKAIRRMLESNARRIVVRRGRDLVGIVSPLDFAALLAWDQADHQADATDDPGQLERGLPGRSRSATR